jgi:hypothetical protein
MTTTNRQRLLLLFLAVLGIFAAALAQAAGGEDSGFMPKGGKTLLLELLGAQPPPAELRSITQARRSEAEWRAFVESRKQSMSERERATLAAYLAVNMPLPDPGQPASALPRDGRELAWEGCQSCHSLFASYLTHSREVQGWRNMFMSPFHRELKMTPQEREEFARYSAINMPMKIDEVPQDLRF